MSQSVIFDLDDTLIDRTRAVEIFAHEVKDHLNLSFEISTPAFAAKVLKLDGGGYTPREAFFQALNETFSLTPTQASTLKEYFYDSVWVRPVVLEGTVEGLEHLVSKGIKIGIVTNGSHEAQSKKISNSGFKHLIDSVLISESFGAKKPDISIFKAACKSLDVEAENSWFVGDHPLNDIWGSKQAGFKTAWIHRNKVWDSDTKACYDLQAENITSMLAQLNCSYSTDLNK